MEILNQFLFGNPEIQKAIGPLALAAIAAAPGLIKSVGSMFGSAGRRREERAAAANLANRTQAYEQFQFQDPAFHQDFHPSFSFLSFFFQDLSSP